MSGFSTGTFTSDNTGHIIIPFLHWLLPHASAATLDDLHLLIRKCGHLTEYSIFSLLILRAIRAGRREWKFSWALAAVLAVIVYASLDEFHQSFVPGRTAAVSDVLLDTVGGTAAQIVAAMVIRRGQA
jgi:VanZ family protein